MKPSRVKMTMYGDTTVQDFFYSGGLLARIKYTSKDLHGTQTWNQTFDYDGKGNLTHAKGLGEEAVLKYNPVGRLIEETVTKIYKNRPIVTEKYVDRAIFEYGTQGSLTGSTRTSSYNDGPERKWTFLYETDNEGQITKATNVEDQLIFTYEYVDVWHHLSGLRLPVCFLTGYESTTHLYNQYSVVKKNNEGFPLEINQIDVNGLKHNFQIRYVG